MKKAVLTLIVIFNFSFCRNQDGNMLVSKIEDHCDQNFPCQFYMEELINVQWDKVYIFKEEASLEFINEKMGFA